MRLVDVTPRTVDDWLAWLPQDQKAMRANAIKAAHAIFATAAKPGAHGEPPLIPLESLRRPYGRQIPSRQGDASGDTGGAEGDA